MTESELKCAAIGIVIYEYIMQNGKAPDIDNEEYSIISRINDSALESALAICDTVDIDTIKFGWEE